MERINIRIPEGIKDVWKRALKELGYLESRGMTDFITDAVNEKILQNQDLNIPQEDKNLIQVRQREILRNKIRYERKQHRSGAFLVQRYVKILEDYFRQGNFIDNQDLIDELKFLIREAKTYPDPKRIYFGVLPELRKHEYEPGIALIKAELLNLGVNRLELDKNFNPNSIKHQIRKQKSKSWG